MLHIKDIELQIEKDVRNKVVPGFALSIINEKETLYKNAWGKMNWEESTSSITTDTLFRIGSVSKLLTATLIMKLVQEGILQLDVPIRKYVPHFTLQHNEAAETITLRMLLSHTAGLPDGGEVNGPRDQEGWNSYIETIVPNLQLVNPPGALYSYGNHAYNIAGYVAQYVCNKPFAELMKEYIFEPLGMNRTMYDPLEAMTYPLALAHEKTSEDDWNVQHQFVENITNYPSFFGMSTITDLSRFAMMHINKGVLDGKVFLQSDMIEKMHTKQIDNYTLSEFGSCLGLISEKERGYIMLWHSGAISTYKCFLVFFPEKKIGFVTMATQEYGWSIIEMLVERFIGPVVEQNVQIVGANPTCWKEYEGNYLGSKRGFVSITIEEDCLMLEWNGEKVPLEAIRNDFYVAHHKEDKISVGFRVIDNSLKYVIINGSACKSTTIQRETVQQTAWAEYEGTYSNGVFQFSFITLDGKPVFVDEEQHFMCTPITAALFYAEEYGLLRFTQNAEGMRILSIQDAWHMEAVNEKN
ncbi:serine hydrolase domain-containing protein [Bacillus manliponensis]|uniref:serine hydrolase domain-containing protein n=1 Tax=Bacillus manliponensis TaxID=574376 RepID=UPI003516017E